MKKKKNSTYYRYTRKQILVLSVLVIFCLSLVTILARYVLKYANNFYTSTKEFYFESDKLKESNPTYRIEQWTGINSYSIPIKLSTAKNTLEKLSYNVDYQISYSCSSNITCQLSKTSGTIYTTNNLDTVTLRINPNTALNVGDQVTINVTASTTEPYSKTISAKFVFIIGNNEYSYKIEDAVGQIYCDLVITNTTNYYIVLEAFGSYAVGDKVDIYSYSMLDATEKAKCKPTKFTQFGYDPQILSLDMANTTVELFSQGTENQGSVTYVVGSKVGVKAESSARVRFYKKDPTQNYTYPINNNTSIITVEFIDWT